MGSEIEQLLIGGFNSTGKILINFLFVFGSWIVKQGIEQ